MKKNLFGSSERSEDPRGYEHEHENKHEHEHERKHEHKHGHAHTGGCSHEHSGGCTHDKCGGNSPMCQHGDSCCGAQCCSDDHIGCGCGCVKPADKSAYKRELITLAAAAAVAALGLIPAFGGFSMFIFIAAYIICGYGIYVNAFRNFAVTHNIDENFLMIVATLGALFLGNYLEAIAVVMFYRIGALFESAASGKASKNINALLDIMPEKATVIRGGEMASCSPSEVSVGQKIYVRPGERIPLDGTVIEGKSVIDRSAITGESAPEAVNPGDFVMSGCINMNAALTINVTAEYSNSTVARMIALTKSAGERKAKSERFITAFSRIYTPAICLIAFGVAVMPPIIMSQPFGTWIYRALTLLVISCPCALLLSVPLAYFGGIGGLSRRGVFVKGGRVIDALARVHAIAFDKTGTLTKGEFGVISINPAEPFSEAELLKLAAAAEAASNHPIALAVRRAAEFDESTVRVGEYEEIAGAGVCWRPEGQYVLAGNGKLMEKFGISYSENISANTIVYIAANGKFVGSIEIADPLRNSARMLASQLAHLGIVNLCMLTGDRQKTATSVARQIGINKVYAELLPDMKAEKIEKLRGELEKGATVAFCGDGINDSPSLAVADVGISSGKCATDAAIEASDVILMNDNLALIPEAIRISRKTKGIALQNIILALAAKAVILILTVMGYGSMWLAVFADVGVCVITVLNSIRCLGGAKNSDPSI